MDDKNQGEGDKKSARRFNERQQDFIESERGRQKIEQDHSDPDADTERLDEAQSDADHQSNS